MNQRLDVTIRGLINLIESIHNSVSLLEAIRELLVSKLQDISHVTFFAVHEGMTKHVQLKQLFQVLHVFSVVGNRLS